MQRRSRILSLLAFVLGLSSGWFLNPAEGVAQQGIPQGYIAKNIQPISYVDMEPVFKVGIQEVGGRWYLYTSHLWYSGWSIVDVTDPRAPKLVKTIEGPPNTWTIQIDVEDGKMMTPLEQKTKMWYGDETKPFEEGFLMWDISDPVNPKQLMHYKTGGTGMHRSEYPRGPYVHTASRNVPGFRKPNGIYEIVDWQKNQVVGRFWLPGQKEGETPPLIATLHGPPYVEGNYAYIPYGEAGFVIADISDVKNPKFVSRLDFYPPFQEARVAHTAFPLPERKLAIVLGEASGQNCSNPLTHASIVDIHDLKNPRMISLFPVPIPPPGASYKNFCEKPGRFGPHNINAHSHNPLVEKSETRVYMTYDNAGLRVYDISDARLPREVAYFLPPTPKPGSLVNRRSPANQARGNCPTCDQVEDVLVDTRGFIYLTDSTQGLWILRLSGG